MSNARIDIRLPGTEKEQLRFLREETGASYTDILRAAIALFLLKPALLVELVDRQHVNHHQGDADQEYANDEIH